MKLKMKMKYVNLLYIVQDLDKLKKFVVQKIL